MKTILVPTDYSKPSINALNYAIMLAKQTKSKILLFHAFQIPVASPEVGVVAIPFDDIEKVQKERLKKLADNLNKQHKSIKIGYLTQAGFAVDMIQELVNSKKIDLIVMGIKGAGKVSEVIIGSTSSSVAANTKCPVLIVPEKAVFEKPAKIIFASDNEKPAHASNLKSIKEVISAFKSKLLLLTVIDEKEPTDEDKKKSLAVEKYFSGINHSVNFINNKYDDVITAINYFVKKNKANMVTMIARKHSFFYQLFNERKTKKMAFHTRVPLLILSDK